MNETAWVGAFGHNGVCAGASQVISFEDSTYCHIVVYGSSTFGQPECCDEGESFTLRLFDPDSNLQFVLVAGDTLDFPFIWTNLNGGNLNGSAVQDVNFSLETAGCDDPGFLEFNTPPDWPTDDCITLIVEGCSNPAFVEFNPAVNLDDGTCSTPAVVGCTDSGFLEYDELANFDDGSCTTAEVPGCTDPEYLQFDSEANTDDGSCVDPVVVGCTGIGYVEYDAEANVDDGSCSTVAVPGCPFEAYLEYDPEANLNDGSCLTPVLPGCTIEGFVEFDPNANVDDGSCITTTVLGCIDPGFLEYNAQANTENGTCITTLIPGCLDTLACNFDASANLQDSTCAYPLLWYPDLDGDGLGSDDGGALDCEQPSSKVANNSDGCDDTLACNYTWLEAQSCQFPALFYVDLDGDGIGVASDFVVACAQPVGTALLSGDICEDTSACNYYGLAEVPCRYEDAVGTCGGNCAVDSNENGICDSEELQGCINDAALNFNPSAAVDDGSCIDSAPPSFFELTPTPQSAFLSGVVVLDSAQILPGDWILARTHPEGLPCGAFPLTSNSIPYFNLPLYGDDATTLDIQEGLMDGGLFTLHYYDTDQSSEFACTSGEDTLLIGPWTPTNGGHLPALPPMQSYVFSVHIEGCTDADFQEFNDEATTDNGSCSTPLEEGCTNPDFIEFNPTATVEDGSCVIPVLEGCTDPNFQEFNPSANVDDGSCLTPGIGGCTNPYFLEFDPDADFDDGSCQTFLYLGCTNPGFLEFNPLATVDDGSCTTPSIPGCTDAGFLEFSAIATLDDGSCLTVALPGCTNPEACNFSPDANLPDGTCTLPLTWFADSDGDGLGDGLTTLTSCSAPSGYVDNALDGCDDLSACNFELPWAPACTLPNVYFADADFDGLGDAQDSILSCQPVVGYSLLAGDNCSDLNACNFDDPNNAPCVFPDVVGNCGGTCETDENGNGICDPLEIQGCMDPDALNFSPLANVPGIPCVIFDEGSTLPEIQTSPLSATFYGSITLGGEPAEATDMLLAFDTAGQCIGASYLVMIGGAAITALTLYGDDPGSTYVDEGALEGEPFTLGLYRPNDAHLYPYPNFETPAQLVGWSNQNGAGLPGFSDWTIEYAFDAIRGGCTDDGYLEYDALADADDGSCITPVILGCTDSGFVEFNPLANTDDGTCTTLVVLGCTDDTFFDFDPLANTDDGSCSDPIPQGCTNPDFIEFDPLAILDDGTCATPVVLGCTDSGFLEFDPAANVDDGSCYAPIVLGCTDFEACNYSATANVDDGTCILPEFGFDCSGECLEDADGDGICNPFEVAGCTYPSACNFNPEATDDNGSCFFSAPGTPCPEPCAEDADGDGICDADEILGCLDTEALNYASTATEEGVCYYPSDCPTDIDGDEAIGVGDILMLLTAFGTSCNYDLGPCPEDVDASGGVTISDLILLLTEFGNNCINQ